MLTWRILVIVIAFVLTVLELIDSGGKARLAWAVLAILVLLFVAGIR